MKKLSSMLALGLAFSLMMGMTAFASSPNQNSVGAVVTQGKVTFKDNQTKKQYEKEAQELKKNVGTVTLHAGNDNLTLTTQTVAPETLYEAKSIALSQVQSAINSGKIKVDIKATEAEVKVVAAFTVEDMTFSNQTLLTFNISGVKTDKKYVFLHLKNSGGNATWEVIPATAIANGQLSGAFTELSPLVVVEVTKKSSATTSPKTGETFPVAGTLAVICAAGALACAAKSRSRK